MKKFFLSKVDFVTLLQVFVSISDNLSAGVLAAFIANLYFGGSTVAFNVGIYLCFAGLLLFSYLAKLFLNKVKGENNAD